MPFLAATLIVITHNNIVVFAASASADKAGQPSITVAAGTPHGTMNDVNHVHSAEHISQLRQATTTTAKPVINNSTSNATKTASTKEKKAPPPEWQKWFTLVVCLLIFILSEYSCICKSF
jgi:hypothetical protein